MKPTKDTWKTTLTSVPDYAYAKIDREAFIKRYGKAAEDFLAKEREDAIRSLLSDIVEEIEGEIIRSGINEQVGINFKSYNKGLSQAQAIIKKYLEEK